MGREITVIATLTSKEKEFYFEFEGNTKRSCIDSALEYASDMKKIFINISKMFSEEKFIAHIRSSGDDENSHFWWAIIKSEDIIKSSNGHGYYDGREWVFENTDTPNWYQKYQVEKSIDEISIIHNGITNIFHLKGFTANEIKEIAKFIYILMRVDYVCFSDTEMIHKGEIILKSNKKF